MKIIESITEFDQLIASNKPVLVDFFAEWCGPCKMISPVLEELCQTYNTIEFVKVDVDALGELAQRYSVMSIPALFIFKEGQVVKSVVGFQAKPAIEALLNQIK